MRTRLPLLIICGLVAGIGAGLLLIPGALTTLLPKGGLPSVGQATVGGPFMLTHHTGRRITDQEFRGRYMLVFFGFTYCPDVCPSALQIASAALDKLGPKAAGIVPIFITVDPERDTPAQMASYVSSIHPSLVGLTGTPEETQAAAKAYRVYYQKVKDEKSSAGYTIDHTSIIYLMDREGRFVSHFTHASSVDTLVAVLKKHL